MITILLYYNYTKYSIDVYYLSFQGVLLELQEKPNQILKLYGSNIKCFTFVKPTDEMVATINELNILQLWDVSTGKLVNILYNLFYTDLSSIIIVLFYLFW